MPRRDRPTMLGKGERAFLERTLGGEDRDDRPELLQKPVEQRRTKRAEQLAREALGRLDDLPEAIRTGDVEINVSDGTTGNSAVVSFPTGLFSAPPHVVVTADDVRVVASFDTVTTTGFTVVARRWHGTGTINGVEFHWIAMERPG